MDFTQQCRPYTAGKKYHLETYGCQMNVHDSELIAGILVALGMEKAEGRPEADLIIFNTCCVREGAEDRVYGNLGKLRKLKEQKPGLIVGLCGCMAKEEGVPEQLKKRFPFVELLFGNRNQHMLPRLLLDIYESRKPSFSPEGGEDMLFDKPLPILRTSPHTAYINIMYGCNNFCSYCIVPYVRGREKSRPEEEIVAEARRLAEKGCKQITLLGQNVNSYGKDGSAPGFPALLHRLNGVEGLSRILFMTSHPKDLSDELIDAMAECEKVCHYLHLPVQSGSSRVLARMNRGYTREHYLQLVQKLRARVPGIGLTTDVIVGFPGETEEDFEETVSLFQEVGFSGAYTFLYSRRTGTPAAEMEGQIPLSVQKERLSRLLLLQKENARKWLSGYEGKTYPVFAESVSKRDERILTGRTFCGVTVNFAAEKELLGQTVPVHITKAKENTLFGKQVKEDALG